jgi:hypothetical protein
MFPILWSVFFEPFSAGDIRQVPSVPRVEAGRKVKQELRNCPRLPLNGRILLLWKDRNQQIRQLHALMRNISGGGALVQSYRALPVGTMVRIRSRKLFFAAGCARVQHCSRSGLTYRIGLKFYKDLAARYWD